HANGLGQNGHLFTDIAVAHDAKVLVAHLPGVDGGLVPLSPVDFRTAGEDVAHQHDDLSHGQLHDRTGIAVRGVEDHHSLLLAVLQVNLSGPYAKGSHHQ